VHFVDERKKRGHASFFKPSRNDLFMAGASVKSIPVLAPGADEW
jgi:hypothetical protein